MIHNIYEESQKAKFEKLNSPDWKPHKGDRVFVRFGEFGRIHSAVILKVFRNHCLICLKKVTKKSKNKPVYYAKKVGLSLLRPAPQKISRENLLKLSLIELYSA